MSTYYNVNSANTNRIVRVRVEAADAGDADSALFGILKGRAAGYPHYGAQTAAPTANQYLAQERTNLVVRALTAYAIPVGVKLADDSEETGGLTATQGPALIIEFETDESGVFYNNAWGSNTTLPKNSAADIADTVGTGGMNAPKTKKGLSSLLADLATVSWDGGTTGPFGALSASGNIVLEDGRTTAAAPALNGGVGTNASGLIVTVLD